MTTLLTHIQPQHPIPKHNNSMWIEPYYYNISIFEFACCIHIISYTFSELIYGFQFAFILILINFQTMSHFNNDCYQKPSKRAGTKQLVISIANFISLGNCINMMKTNSTEKYNQLRYHYTTLISILNE